MMQEDEHIGEFGPGEEGASAMKSGMERAWYAHMAGLRSSYNRAVTANPMLRDPRIDTLLDPVLSDHARNATNWTIPNEIEILLVRLKTGADLEVALDSAFTTALAIMVPTAAVLAKRRETSATDDDKQAVLATVLRDTHNRFAARRSERSARRIVALRMARIGLWLLGIVGTTILVLGLNLKFYPNEKDSVELGYHFLSRFNMAVAVFFGLVGAFLSRLIALQNSAVTLSVDDLENGYAPHFIFVRLVVGSLSALVVYFIIAGQLIGGDLFPSPSNGDSSGFGQLWATFDRRSTLWNPHGQSYTGPTANFAKLIVWCFIAGFSERFLPDHLSALEAKSKA